MTDTAQPATAAETEVATDPIADAANAFKTFDPAAEETPERERDDRGRFVAATPAEEAEEEIEAEGAEAQAAESDEETVEGEDAPDEGQQTAADMPASWSKEDEELWTSLPPEAQAKIADREGQRDRAVNQKFQEAANVLKANEAVVTEANTNRQRYAESIDQVLSLIRPQWPSEAMLDVNSSDYDPDQYHLLRARAERLQGTVQHLANQRQEIAAQEKADDERAAAARAQEITQATAPAFIRDFPEANDPAKAEGFFSGLVKYALDSGAPADFFQSGPVTAVEWHIIAKAQKYDEQQAAKARVRQEPKPEPRRPQPAVRPGVTTPRSAIEASKRKANLERLDRTGSVEAGAAVFKDFLKGT